MQVKLDYFKNFLKVLIWPFLLGIGQFLLILIFTIFFNIDYINTLKEQYPNLNSTEISTKFQEILGTNKYVQELNEFLVDKSLIIIIVLTIVFLPIFIKKYRRKVVESKKKLKNKDWIKIIVVSLFLAISLNLVLYIMNTFIPFTNRYDNTNTKFFMIITTGVLSPILEEYIFRGLIYNELKKFNSKKTAMILVTVVFALFHLEFSQIIYSALIGLYLIYLYDKTDSIKVSIVAHIIINTSTLLFIPFIVSTNIFIQIGLIIIFSLGIYQNLSIKEK